MRKVLGADFFARPTLEVAQGLLGSYLCRTRGKEAIRRKITEVEVYDGFRDKASHASRGKTARNSHMFGVPGVWYVYFTYGIHWMLNIVTREEGYPAAVLIRGVEDISGPARVTKFFGIDGALNGMKANMESGLWVEAGERIPPEKIKKSGRIGVAYAGAYWARRKWRFYTY
jgi:DNA-3-methyladenine glycosylase